MSPHRSLDAPQRRQLLALARASIESALREGYRTPCANVPRDTALDALRSAFVTLRIDDALRGCCGSIDAQVPLAEDVWRNAWAAAFSDPRFPPLTAREYPGINVHISALSALEPLPAMNEGELLHVLQPGIDGLLLRRGAGQATFLPAVWQQLPDAADFLRHLKMKAGWPTGFWSPDIEVFRYTAESFGENSALHE